MASVSKSAVPASVSSIRELKSTVTAIDFCRVLEGRANIVSLSSFLLAFFLCAIRLFLFLSFRLGVALQRSLCISVFFSFRLGVTLQLCFVLAVFLCCFPLARLVSINLFFFLSSCCLVRNQADLTCFLLTIFLSIVRGSIYIVLFSYCFNEIRRI